MGRRSRSRRLDAWINGRFVGQWRIPARRDHEFQYDPGWMASPEGRPLSLSLPFTPDNQPLRGNAVESYFDNLLPDSEDIRRRFQSRFATRSRDAFDLLAAIGRDCAGAVQLLPEGEISGPIDAIHVEPLGEDRIERLIERATTSPVGAWSEDDDFRISIAGAQEKTAFTWHGGRWCRPLGSTPTTHIFKLPLGLVGHRRADMRTSVENEWLCARLLHALGLPIAPCEMRQFGRQKVLVVERFDRKLAQSGSYWLRLPQEDFCQATGTPAAAKYEADGGPGLAALSRILHSSLARDEDLATLMRAQLLFWLLAATDGHAKNFSLHLLPGARFRMAPLYDVLSAWPVTGEGADRLDYRKLKLAMALRGRNVHYHLAEIRRRHFNETARLCGLGPDMDRIIDDVVARVPGALKEVGGLLPSGFPADVFDAVTNGVMRLSRQIDRDRDS